MAVIHANREFVPDVDPGHEEDEMVQISTKAKKIPDMEMRLPCQTTEELTYEEIRQMFMKMDIMEVLTRVAPPMPYYPPEAMRVESEAVRHLSQRDQPIMIIDSISKSCSDAPTQIPRLYVQKSRTKDL